MSLKSLKIGLFVSMIVLATSFFSWGCDIEAVNDSGCDASIEGDCGVDAGELKFQAVSLAELRCQRVTPQGVWESTRFRDSYATDGCGSTWFELAARRQVRFSHPLARRPDVILVYVAPTSDGQGATLAMGSLISIADATSQWITLDNSTQSSQFIRIVMW